MKGTGNLTAIEAWVYRLTNVHQDVDTLDFHVAGEAIDEILQQHEQPLV
jgi:hypothetical protein